MQTKCTRVRAGNAAQFKFQCNVHTCRLATLANSNSNEMYRLATLANWNPNAMYMRVGWQRWPIQIQTCCCIWQLCQASFVYIFVCISLSHTHTDIWWRSKHTHTHKNQSITSPYILLHSLSLSGVGDRQRRMSLNLFIVGQCVNCCKLFFRLVSCLAPTRLGLLSVLFYARTYHSCLSVSVSLISLAPQ